MRHVDDGTLHAWLDGEVADGATAAWVDGHLRECAECAARLAEARATIAHADALLARAAPGAEQPSYDRVLERAHGQAATPTRHRRWIVPTSWAASIVVAAALGWTARDVTSRYSIETRPVVAEAPGPRAGTPRDVAPSAAAPAASDAPEVAARPATAMGTTQTPAPPAIESARRARTAPAAIVPSPVSPPAEDGIPGEARSFDVQLSPPANTLSAAQSSADSPRATTDLAAAQPASAVPGGLAEGIALSEAAGSLQASGVSAPVAVTGQTPVVTRENSAAGPILASSAARAPAPQASVLGGTVALGENAPDWQVVSRTEAAARTGMPLYGIDGVMPTLTAVDARSNTVKTVYRLPSGSNVELLQEVLKTQGPGGALFVQPTQALANGGARRAEAGLAQRPEWSGVRGNVRLTLRPLDDGADVSDLSTRLRVD